MFFAELTIVGISETAALAATALIGYIFGRRTRGANSPEDAQLRKELTRATKIAASLQRITDGLRRDLAAHHASVVDFSQRLSNFRTTTDPASWESLSQEAQAILEPTIRFANQVSQAYDQLRQQSKELLTFADTHLDLTTRLGNRRALEEQLKVMFETWDGTGPKFAVALFSIDGDGTTQAETTPVSDAVLKEVAALAEKEVRSSDFVARYGQNEIIALLPRTGLPGATTFANRFRWQVDCSTDAVVSGGLAEVLPGDSPKELLARVDSALYSARAEGCKLLFLHDGTHIRQIETETTSPEPTLSGPITAAADSANGDATPPPCSTELGQAADCSNSTCCSPTLS